MVFIVLVNWNGAFDTIRCLESVFRSTYKQFKVIIVDNLSQDDSIEIICAWAERRLSLAEHGKNQLNLLSIPPLDIEIPCLKIAAHQLNFDDGAGWRELIEKHQLFIVANSANSGFGAGNNVGFKLIQLAYKCDHFWLLNNDTVVRPDTLDTLVKFAENHPRTVTGSILYYYDNPNQIQSAGGGFFSRHTGITTTNLSPSTLEIDYVNGASFFAPVAYLNEVGGFDENIFMYFEEIEYCIRGKKEGFAFRCSDAVIFHKMGGSNFGLQRAWQEIFKNKYYAMRKHFGFGSWQLFYFASIMINATKLNRNAEKRRAANAFILKNIYKIFDFSLKR